MLLQKGPEITSAAEARVPEVLGLRLALDVSNGTHGGHPVSARVSAGRYVAHYTIGLEILLLVAVRIERERRALSETLAMDREVSQSAVTKEDQSSLLVELLEISVNAHRRIVPQPR